MKRRKLLKGIAGLLMAERLLHLQAAWAAGQQPLPPGMHTVSGEVTVNGRPAQPGMLVQAGDQVVTGSGGKAIYVIGRDAYLQRERSSVQFLGDSVSNGLRVISGKLLSVFGKGDKRIETPTATIGIRGTGCYIEVESERIYFCLCYGQAEIIPLARPSERELIETRHHDKPMYISADARRVMAPATVQNHSDDELTLLEALVGRVPPFLADGGYPRY